MYRFILTGLLLLISAIADAKSDERESVTFGGTVDISAQFAMGKYFASSNRTFYSYGKAIISPTNGICFEMQQPKYHRWLISKEILEFDQDGNATSVFETTDPTVSFMNKSFLSLVRGDVATIKREFAITWLQQDKHFQMKPKNELIAKMIDSIDVFYHDKYIEEIRILEKNGSSTAMKFTEQQTLSNIEDKDKFCRTAL